MKLYVLLTLFICLSFHPFASADRAGGGGNAGESTPAQVEAVLKKIRSPLNSIFYDAGTGQLRGMSKDLQAVFDKIVPKGSWTFEDLEIGTDIGYDSGLYNGKPFGGSPFILKKDGPCIDMDGSEKDAAVTAPKPLTPICFSIPRLIHIPPESLEKRILALAAHEFVHHYNNFGELEAQMVQIYILEHYEELTGQDGLRKSLGRSLQELSSSVRNIVYAVQSNISDELVCLRIGYLQIAALNTDVIISNYGFKGADYGKVSYDLMSRASGMSNFCGRVGSYWGSDVKEYQVSAKDKLGLDQKAKEFLKIESDLQLRVKKAAGYEAWEWN